MTNPKPSNFLDQTTGDAEPQYLVEAFMHISDDKKPWWFNKDELEKLGKVIAQGWTIDDNSRMKYDDRVVIKGGAHDFHIRKKFVLEEGRPVYDTVLDDQGIHTFDFRDVLNQLASYVAIDADMNKRVDQIKAHLTYDELNHP